METKQFPDVFGSAFPGKPGGRTPKGNGDSTTSGHAPRILFGKPGGRTPKGNGDAHSPQAVIGFDLGSRGAERRKAMETFHRVSFRCRGYLWKPGGRTPKGNGDIGTKR